MTYAINKNRIISVLLIMIIVLMMIMTSYIQADAFAPAIAVTGAVVVLAIVTALGVSTAMGWTDTAAMCQHIYDGMTGEIKEIIDRYKTMAQCESLAFAMLRFHFAESDWPAIKAWFSGEFIDVSGTYATNTTIPEGYQSVFNPTLAVPAVALTRYNSVSAPKVLIKTGSYFEVINGTTLYLTMSGDCYYHVASGDSSASRWFCYPNGTGIGSWPTSNSATFTPWNSTLSDLVKYESVPFASGGTAQSDSGAIDWTRDSAYDPDTNPIVAASDGTVPVTLPYGDVTSDTNVALPEDNSIDNPLGLDAVISAYGSIDNFFEQGGVITLADGTTIGNVQDYARSQDVPLADTGTGTVEGDVSGIKSIVGRISGLLSGVAGAVSAIAVSASDLFNVSDFDIDFDPLKVGFSDKFPFCIPFDFVNLISVFSANPTDFQFQIQLDTDYFQIDHTVDLSPFRIPILFFRYVVVTMFVYILISRTRDLMKW